MGAAQSWFRLNPNDDNRRRGASSSTTSPSSSSPNPSSSAPSTSMRKRKGAPSAASSAEGSGRSRQRKANHGGDTTKKKDGAHEMTDSTIGRILEQLRCLSNSNARCSFALQALLDGDNKGGVADDTSESSASLTNTVSKTGALHPHPDTSLLLASTLAINRLIKCLQLFNGEKTEAEENTPDDEKSTPNDEKSTLEDDKSPLSSSDSTTREQHRMRIALVLSSLCYHLAKALLSDRPRLERCSNSSTSAGSCGPSPSPRSARGVVGRAIVSVTLAAALAMDALSMSTSLLEGSMDSESSDDSSGQKDDKHTACMTSLRDGIWAAFSALEMAVHLSPKAVSSSSRFWDSSFFFSTDVSPDLKSVFVSACRTVDETLSAEERSEIETAITSPLQEQAHNIEEPSSPLTKRQRRSKTSKYSATDGDDDSRNETEISSIPHTEEQLISFDGRISIRRWSSMALVWLVRGQLRLFEAASRILSLQKWNKVLSSPVSVPQSKSTASAQTHSTPIRRTRLRGQMKKASTEVPSEGAADGVSQGPVPGNVSRVVLASRLVDLISESGIACGVRPPTGGMDVYAAVVLGLLSTTQVKEASTGSSSSKTEHHSPDVSGAVTRSGRTRQAAASGSSSMARFSTLASSITWERPDLRPIAAVVMRLIIVTHAFCLKENYATSDTKSKKNQTDLVNEDGNGASSSATSKSNQANEIGSNNLTKFYPGVYRTIDVLSRAAASSVVSSAHVDVSDSVSRLSAIGCAIVLAECVQVDKMPIDAKLLSLAVTRLSESISGIVSLGCIDGEDEEGEEKREQASSSLECLHLNSPIMPRIGPSEHGETILTATSLSSSSSSPPTLCTFGGVFSDQHHKQQENCHPPLQHSEVLALFLRALNPPPPKGTDTAVRAPASSPTTTHKSKRRKMTKEKPSANAEDVREMNTSSPSDLASTLLSKLLFVLKCCYHSEEEKSTTRSTCITLASDVLNALRKCLQVRPEKSGSKTSCKVPILSLFREALSSKHICYLIDLERSFGETVIRPHVDKKSIVGTSKEGGSNDDNANVSLLTSYDKEFTLPERHLWSAHIKLCLTIGRGQPSFDSRRRTHHVPVIGDANCRLSILQAVATSSNTSKSKNTTMWPLCLPAAQHALVSSNLTAEPIPSNVKEAEPERFLCGAFVASILHAIGSKDFGESKDSNYSQAEEDIPLSLRDSRLFILSACRLPRKEQRAVLSDIVGHLHTAFTTHPGVRDTVTKNVAASGFLARLITVICTLVDMIIAGPALLELLTVQAGPAHYHLPDLTDAKDSKNEDENDWYKRERCFMGLFSDWESPQVPTVSVIDTAEALSKEDMSKLIGILESALGLGFSSAKNDRCHLLFAAWNASAKSIGWDLEKSWSGPSASESSSPTSKLLAVREDISFLYRKIVQSSSSPRHDSLLSILMEANEHKEKISSKRTSHTTADLLKAGLNDAVRMIENEVECIIENEVECIVKDDDDVTMSIDTFALLESLAVYVSFLVAHHTVHEDDIFTGYSRTRKRGKERQRKNSGSANSGDSFDEDGMMEEDDGHIMSDDSGESDGGYPDFEDCDDDECDDARIDALARLHDACNTIDAAPVHPDWLDMSCRLREGVERGLAIESGKKAVAILTRLGKLAHAQYSEALKCALLVCGKTDKTDGASNPHTGLAVKFFSCVLREKSSNFATVDLNRPHVNASLISNLSTLCDVDKKSLLRAAHPGLENISSPRDAWCPNSAHFIRGKLQELSPAVEGWEATNGEQRATGEWELLLSDALLGSFLGSEYAVSEDGGDNLGNDLSMQYEKKSSDGEESHSVPDNGEEEFIKAERWARILKITISSMVSANALLRLGLNNGKGRKQHPLSKRESNTNNFSPEIAPSSPINREILDLASITSLQEIKSCISDALVFLSHISSDGLTACHFRNVCQVASCHLVRDTMPLRNLESLHCLQNSFSVLFDTSNTIANAEAKQSRLKAACAIVEYAVKCVECCADAFVKKRDDSTQSSNALRRRINSHTSSTEMTTHKKMRFLSLLEFLGFPVILSIDTIVESSVDVMEMLSSQYGPLVGDQANTVAKNAIKLLVSMLCRSQWPLEIKTRCRIALLLCGILSVERERIQCQPHLEDGTVLASAMLEAWNSLDSKDIENIVKEDVCLLSSSSTSLQSDTPEVAFSRRLCSTVGYLLGSINSPGENSSGDIGCKVVLNALLDTLDQWTVEHSSSHVMDLLCLLATRFDELKETGMRLLSLTTSAEVYMGRRISSLEIFSHFIRDVFEAMQNKSQNSDHTTTFSIGQSNSVAKSTFQTNSKMQRHKSSQKIGHRKIPTLPFKSKSGSSPFTTKSGLRVLRTCSFVETGGDFAEQHWYNCYTCGLLWDKGCCSLCAQVCHKGHVLSYSRRSSFFCDCGAEVANSNEQNSRVTCRCLSPLSSEELAKIYNDDCIETAHEDSDASLQKTKDSGCTLDEYFVEDSMLSREKVVREALKAFPIFTEIAINNFFGFAKSNGWTESLFLQFNQCFQAWATKRDSSPFIEIESDVQSEDEMNVSEIRDKSLLDVGNTEETNESLASLSLCLRNGKPLEVESLKNKSMIPTRAAKANSVNLKLSIDNTTDRLKKALLAKNDIRRNVVVADSRGRLIIAEPCSLLFCCALPLVNTRHVEKPLEPLERAQLCILGSAKVKMNIVGMQLCQENERHLVIWGTAEASVIVLSKACDGIERRIDLMVELEPHECETEYMLKCEWMPGSETMIVVVCGTFLKVFDIKRAGGGGGTEKGSTCRSTTCYTLAYEDVLIRAAALVGGPPPYSGDLARKAISEISGKEAIIPTETAYTLISRSEKEYVVKLVLLLDTGRLSMTDLRIDSNGDLEDQGESYIECGEGIRFPIAGIRRYLGANPSTPGSTSTSFGEGSNLYYLKQSGLLLYKCLSAPLVAMKMDKSNKIIGSFELLPHVLASEMLGNGLDGQSISAPYTHWTELGVVKRGGTLTYRIACVGKSTRTSSPKLICIELNEERVCVKELSWAAGLTVGLGLSLSTSFEGLAAFSAPCQVGNHSRFSERAFLACLHSNGSMLIFGEEMDENDSHNSEDASHALFSRHRALSDSDAGCSDDATPIFTKVETMPDRSKESKIIHPKFPLTIFETLINVSEMNELTFGGDGISNEPNSATAKRKLSISNGDFLVSPSKEGCTLTVSFRSYVSDITSENQDNTQSAGKRGRNAPEVGKPGIVDGKRSLCDTTNKILSSESGTLASSLAIVAVRILVGNTTTEYLPRQVTVMGRTTKLSQGMKRWYDLPLTNEEIILGVRCGCVCIGIGTSFENCPIVDAVEVYAKKREEISYLASTTMTFGRSIRAIQNDTVEGFPAHRGMKLVEQTRQALISSLLCVIHGCRILRESVDPSIVSHETMQKLVQMTALDRKGDLRDHVLELLKEVEADSNVRQVLIDEGTLLGLGLALKGLTKKLCSSEVEDDGKVQDKSTIEVDCASERKLSDIVCLNALNILSQCLKLSLVIAKERPENYEQANKKMTVERIVNASIAVDAKFVLDTLMMKDKNFFSKKGWNISASNFPTSCKSNKRSADYTETASLLVELALIEMAMSWRGRKKSEVDDVACRFADFNLVSDVLKTQDFSQRCCVTIAKVLGENKTSQEQSSKDHQLDESSGVTRETPFIAYKCDGCGLYPISSIRYTLEGENIDFCKICFDSGLAFARSRNNPNEAVQIRGRGLQLRKNEELTCAQIRQMHPVPVESLPAESVPVESAIDDNPPEGTLAKELVGSDRAGVEAPPIDDDDDDAALQIALQMSLETPSSDPINETHPMDTDISAHNESLVSLSFLRNSLFDSLLKESIRMTFFQLQDSSDSSENTPVGGSSGVNQLLQLVLHLVISAESSELRIERGKKVAEALVTKLSRLVHMCLTSDLQEEVARQARVSMIIALRTLVRLLTRRDTSIQSGDLEADFTFAEGDGDSSLGGAKNNKDKTDPRFVCDVHGVPAIRRRCSHGVNRNRRFYVCGMERRVRCKYFKWADDEDCTKPRSQTVQGHGQRNLSQPGESSTMTSSSPKKLLQNRQPGPCDQMQTELWKLFSVPRPDGSPALQSQLCELLQVSYKASEVSFSSSCDKNLTKKSTSEDEKSSGRTSSSPLQSLKNEKSIMEDLRDGVMMCREKLGPTAAGASSKNEIGERGFSNISSATLSDDSDSSFIQASLDLLSHLATNSLQPSSMRQMNSNWCLDWFSLLCEIISTSASSMSHQRSQAKKMLKRLCGGRRAIYHRVRDHYVFAFQFRTLLDHCGDLLQSALEVVEKAKQCGQNWQKGKEFNWKNLFVGGLLGVEGLVPEDSLTVNDEERVKSVLDELIEITKSRGGNWRQFCAMTELPHIHSKNKGNHTISTSNDVHQQVWSRNVTRENSVYDISPICSLLWMACSLSGSNQVKILRLMDVALTPSDYGETSGETKDEGKDSAVRLADESGILSTDGGYTDVELGGEKSADHSHPHFPNRLHGELVELGGEKSADQSHPHFPNRLHGELGTPEIILLDRSSGLSVDNVYAFVIQFVLRGRNIELRNAASKVAEKIFRHIPPKDLHTIFIRFMGSPLHEIGFLGCAANEFLQLMQIIVRDYGSMEGFDLKNVAKVTVDCFVHQMKAMDKNFYGGVGEEAGMLEIENDNGSTVKKWFDLCSCVHCHRYLVGAPNSTQYAKSSTNNDSDRSSSTLSSSATRASGKNDATLSLGTVNEAGGRASAVSEKSTTHKQTTPWLVDQVRPFTRNRLEASTERVVSTEFATHVQLKFRLAISEIHLTVQDPRGRLVKTIGIFFSPRPAGDINDLKTLDIWQRCGTLSLARGAMRATCTLKTPVVAANLKFEYLEFYEKVGGARAADGGILLTCPRCTRVVNNAHGVCGHCGEVAFQCRKCRHINYDKLDAFLCVECGYCASGGFGYEVTAGIASNAVAIIDEVGYERAVKLLRIVIRRLAEMRSGLRKKFLVAAVVKRKISHGDDLDDLENLNKFSPFLKRALLGDLPKGSGKGNGDDGDGDGGTSSIGKCRTAAAALCASRRDQTGRMSAASKGRSLLSLARQLRESEGMDGERSGRGDLLVRQALLNVGGAGGSIEFFDDGGALGEGDGDMFGIINVDMPDPLSRLVANIQARVRSSAMGSTAEGNSSNSKKNTGGSGGRGSDGGGGGGDGGGGNVCGSQQSPQAQLEACTTLHRQMREAERECFELQRTINAWKRLNRDALSDVGADTPLTSSSSFIPTFCSVCAGPVTLHFLVLTLGILRAGTTELESAISKSFVHSLFDEPVGIGAELSDLKRLTIVTLVEKSELGARLVLEELQSRLRATHDVTCAEILGKLIEKEFSISDDYVNLAVEILSRGE